MSDQVDESVELPLIATYRPSGSSVSAGYHRFWCMSAILDQVWAAGSKMLVSTMPSMPVLVWP